MHHHGPQPLGRPDLPTPARRPRRAGPEARSSLRPPPAAARRGRDSVLESLSESIPGWPVDFGHGPGRDRFGAVPGPGRDRRLLARRSGSCRRPHEPGQARAGLRVSGPSLQGHCTRARAHARTRLSTALCLHPLWQGRRPAPGLLSLSPSQDRWMDGWMAQCDAMRARAKHMDMMRSENFVYLQG